MAKLHPCWRSGAGGSLGSCQQWVRCRRRWRGTKWREWVRHVEERSVKHAVRWDDFWEGAQSVQHWCLWWEGAVYAKSRRYRQYSSVHALGLLRISILFILSCHLITTECPHCVFDAPHLASIAFQRSCCHWVLVVLLAPLGDLLRAKVIRDNQSLESGFDPVYCVFIWSETKRHKNRNVNSSGKCFEHNWHWTVRDLCPNSYNSTLPHFLDDATWFLAEFQRVFPDLPEQDFQCVSPSLGFATTCWIFPVRSSSCKITSCAIPSILRWTLNSGSQFPGAVWLWVICWVTLFLSLHFSARKTHSQRCLVVVAAAAIAKPLLSTIFRAGTRRRESSK